MGGVQRVTERRISQLLATPCAVAMASAEIDLRSPYEQEAAIVRGASGVRRAEFAAGRRAARAALSEIGFAAAGILADADKVPIWPAEALGSIAHCSGLCFAVAARQGIALGLGVDAEAAEYLPADVASIICGPRDRAHIRGLPRKVGLDWNKVTFCAKEAFYKAYFPRNRQFVDFHEVAIEYSDFDGDSSGLFKIRSNSDAVIISGDSGRYVGKWALVGGYIITGVTLLNCV